MVSVEEIWDIGKTIIKDMYENYNCQIIHNNKLSQPINVTTGVRQGCILLPLLFVLVMDDLMQQVNSGGRREIQWGLVE